MTSRLFAFDDSGNSSTGRIAGDWRLRITSANGVPTVGSDRFQAQAGKTLSVPVTGVLANDRDPDGDTLTAIQAGPPQKGQVALQADGSFTYKSKQKAKGRDSFTYLAEDPSGLNALATVEIQIKGKKHKHGAMRRFPFHNPFQN